jgi:hypothetical protein
MSDPQRTEGAAPVTRARAKTPLPIEQMRMGMVARELSVSPPDVVFVKGLIEASEGIGALFSERGGDLTIVAPESRWAEMSELLADLELEIGARLGPILPALGESAAAPGESR